MVLHFRENQEIHTGRILSYLPGKGTTTEVSVYSYIDQDLKPGRYSYQLIQHDYDGTGNTVEAITADIDYMNFYVAQNYPNPFNPSTKVKYSLPFNDGSNYKVTLKIYDILGNQVSVAVDEEQSAGSYEVDLSLNNLAGGVYFYELRANNFVSVNKMILQK
jgi:hypothetical protein